MKVNSLLTIMSYVGVLLVPHWCIMWMDWPCAILEKADHLKKTLRVSTQPSEEDVAHVKSDHPKERAKDQIARASLMMYGLFGPSGLIYNII